jgi:hypothetical protein
MARSVTAKSAIKRHGVTAAATLARKGMGISPSLSIMAAAAAITAAAQRQQRATCRRALSGASMLANSDSRSATGDCHHGNGDAGAAA